jgi:hypothetical protein
MALSIFIGWIVSKSIYHKVNMILSDCIDLSMAIKAVISIQISIIIFLVLISAFYILTITDIMEVLIEFVGLLVLVEIDNWAGNLFEVHLDNYYPSILHSNKYLVFKTN